MSSLKLSWAKLIQADFVTLGTVPHQALSMGFSREKDWSGLPFPSPGDLPAQGLNLHVSSALADGFLTSTTWETHKANLAAAKSLQLCPTLQPHSPPGSPVPGILLARILEWVAISFSSA